MLCDSISLLWSWSLNHLTSLFGLLLCDSSAMTLIFIIQACSDCTISMSPTSKNNKDLKLRLYVLHLIWTATILQWLLWSTTMLHQLHCLAAIHWRWLCSAAMHQQLLRSTTMHQRLLRLASMHRWWLQLDTTHQQWLHEWATNAKTKAPWTLFLWPTAYKVSNPCDQRTAMFQQEEN